MAAGGVDISCRRRGNADDTGRAGLRGSDEDGRMILRQNDFVTRML
jgi:hypothetical protein